MTMDLFSNQKAKTPNTYGVITISDELFATLNVTKKTGATKVYPWRSTPIGGRFARPLRLTNGKAYYPPKSLKKDNIAYDILYSDLNNEAYAIYVRKS